MTRSCWFVLLAPMASLAGLLLGTSGGPRAAAPVAKTPAVDFGRQVLPILSENCFACHGPDAKTRKARLRLDTREGATAARAGGAAIVPGKPADSALIERISADDDSLRMPPEGKGKRLTSEQVAVLRTWIEQGAPYTTHWSLVPPRRSPPPTVRVAAWCRNPIDRFILARLEAESLRPSPQADRATLIRRVTLDLTGLPPTPAEVDAFLADGSVDAYERVVDRLLQSPRYGEQRARFWLDVARYGDTHGLHLDNYREMWPYREWVLRAFNRNLPYDQFLTEQLAGDLLPAPTQDQLIASGFNRCHVTTAEGGSIEEECYVRNVDDRVDTFGTTILGLSLGCCRCHDHKYDPFTTKDYYAFFAFFNSLDENPLDGNVATYPPIIHVATPDQARIEKDLDRQADAVRKDIAAAVAAMKYEDPVRPPAPRRSGPVEHVWIDDDLPVGVRAFEGSPNAPWTFVSRPKYPVLSGTRSLRRSETGLTQNTFADAQPGLRVGAGDQLFAHVWIDPKDPPREIMLQWHTDSWDHRAYWGENKIDWGKPRTASRRYMGPLPPAGQWMRLEVDAARVGITPDKQIVGWAFTQFDGTVYWDRAGIVTRTPQAGQSFDSFRDWLQMQQSTGGAGLPAEIQQIVKTTPRLWVRFPNLIQLLGCQGWNPDPLANKRLRDYFIEHAYAGAQPVLEPLRRKLAAIERQRQQLEKRLPTTLVSHELATPRQAYVLKRGEYEQKGEKVQRRTPASLPAYPAGLPRNRLGLARWLVAPEHPLTARVMVNRLWQQCFWTGLVRTAEDFGTQGELPSHPELLDWLAVDFRESGWDIKRLLRLIVTSAAYRQESRVAPQGLTKDPANRLLWRGPRYRLDAEVLRDQALFASGLLVEKLGGPSVKPPQPAGLWEAVGYSASNTAHFVADTSCDKVHRRSLYTFWKRTSPPPQMTAFDAPSRESCCVRRERTNTPLQALVLLNETQYVEAARGLAERILHENASGPEARARLLFRLATARTPDATQVAELGGAYRGHLATYTQDRMAACRLIRIGESRPDPKLDSAELAAWTMVANLVLNLDEVLNKE